ncbi:MAG: hypothetical protein WCB79_10440 [Halobacteriota archaeon]
MPIKDPEKRRIYNREYARRRRAGLTGQTRPTVASTSFVSSRQLENVQDLCQVMKEAINMLLDDQESTPVSRARAIAYCCTVAARIFEMADLAESKLQEQQLHRNEADEADAALDEAWSDVLENPDAHGAYVDIIGKVLRRRQDILTRREGRVASS